MRHGNHGTGVRPLDREGGTTTEKMWGRDAFTRSECCRGKRGGWDLGVSKEPTTRSTPQPFRDIGAHKRGRPRPEEIKNGRDNVRMEEPRGRRRLN